MDPHERRRALLVAALGFALLEIERDASVAALRAWLCTWEGLGAVAAGMARQGYDLSLTRYDEQGWRATFYVSGMVHSTTGAVGSAWARTPWHAVLRAAWDTLHRASA